MRRNRCTSDASICNQRAKARGCEERRGQARRRSSRSRRRAGRCTTIARSAKLPLARDRQRVEEGRGLGELASLAGTVAGQGVRGRRQEARRGARRGAPRASRQRRVHHNQACRRGEHRPPGPQRADSSRSRRSSSRLRKGGQRTRRRGEPRSTRRVIRSEGAVKRPGASLNVRPKTLPANASGRGTLVARGQWRAPTAPT